MPVDPPKNSVPKGREKEEDSMATPVIDWHKDSYGDFLLESPLRIG